MYAKNIREQNRFLLFLLLTESFSLLKSLKVERAGIDCVFCSYTNGIFKEISSFKNCRVSRWQKN